MVGVDVPDGEETVFEEEEEAAAAGGVVAERGSLGVMVRVMAWTL